MVPTSTDLAHAAAINALRAAVTMRKKVISFTFWACFAQLASISDAAPSVGPVLSGYVLNQSYTTQCAEVDNVNVPVVLKGTEAFRITATHPRYLPAPIDERGADFSDCRFTDRIIWRIGHRDDSDAEFMRDGFEKVHGYYALDVPASGIDQPASAFPREINTDWMQDQYINFTAAEDGDANVEVKIGATFTVAFKEVGGKQEGAKLDIECRTWNGRAWEGRGNRIFTPETRSHTWHVPDMTWLDGEDANIIQLHVASGTEGGVSVPASWGIYDYLELRKRDTIGETSLTPLYSNDFVAVVPVRIDFWWRHPEAMNVTVKGGGTATNVHYLRILKKMPYSSPPDVDEVFVLYEDGNARIIPLPPASVPWVPYGGSIIIGPSENGLRPFAAIDEVIVDPEDLSLDVKYDSGEFAHLELWVDQTQTVVDVSNITYGHHAAPFARFRSMWVRDGKTDIDRIRAGAGTFPISEGWRQLNGTWWEFFRSVPSYHNTLSPDFKIEVTRPSPAFLVREAEDVDKGSRYASRPLRKASGEAALQMSPDGGECIYLLNLDRDYPATRMRVSYSESDGGRHSDDPGNTITVTLDGKIRGSTYAMYTGGWDEFELTPDIYLGDLDAGDHVLSIKTGRGSSGVYLDRFEFLSQPADEMELITNAVVQAETASSGRKYKIERRRNAVGGETVHLGKEGGAIRLSVNLPSAATNAYLRLRYADDEGPNRIDLRLDGEFIARFPSSGTGGWSQFTNSPNLYLGTLSQGKHTLDIESSAESWGVDIDQVEIFSTRQPQQVLSSPNFFIPSE